MDFIKNILENFSVYIGVALALSEALALLPFFKSNGILDGIIKFLKGLSSDDQKKLTKKKK